MRTIYHKGGPNVAIPDGGHGADDATAGLAALGGLASAAHAVLSHAGIPGVPGNMQAAVFSFPAATNFNTGALGFTPIAAAIITSDGSHLAVGVFKGTGGGDQINGSFTSGLASGVNPGFISQVSWTCTQFTAAGVIASGASRDVGLLVIGQ